MEITKTWMTDIAANSKSLDDFRMNLTVDGGYDFQEFINVVGAPKTRSLVNDVWKDLNK